MTTSGFIHTEIKKSVATVTFSHPASNSFPSVLLQQLTDELSAINNNDAIALIVLKSAGTGAFCAGASFDELLFIKNLEDRKAEEKVVLSKDLGLIKYD